MEHIQKGCPIPEPRLLIGVHKRKRAVERKLLKLPSDLRNLII
jgi:hypothetical protein